MNESRSTAGWVEELREFLEAEEISPPEALSRRILTRVREEMNPSSWRVFAKLAAIQAGVGFVSLFFCPQFGINPMRHSGLAGLFMKLGGHGCMLACGALFLGMSALMASFLLRPEEIRVIRRNELPQFALLGLLSLGTFFCLGNGVIPGIASLWLLGSVLGGLANLELGWMIRRRLWRALAPGL